MTDNHINQITEALKNMDESDSRFLDFMYKRIKLYIEQKEEQAHA